MTGSLIYDIPFYQDYHKLHILECHKNRERRIFSIFIDKVDGEGCWITKYMLCIPLYYALISETPFSYIGA